MKEILLTKGQVALVDDADYEWLNQWKWCASLDNSTFYAYRNDRSSGKRKPVLMHRLILGLTDPKIHGEHIDHNGLNNQRSNLRPATNAQNARNRTKRKNTSSKYKGVHRFENTDNFIAQIGLEGKQQYLGFFKTEIEAAKRYNEEAIKLFGEFACLNKITE